MYSSPKQGLIGVDVADAGDLSLVEQESLDGCGSAFGELAQVLGGEQLVKWLEAKTGGEERLERAAAEKELAGAEAPGVDAREVRHFPRAPAAQLHAHADMLLRGVGVGEHRAGHP